jgi:hypothetical protein
MKVMKTLKELLKAHNIETISGYDRDGEVEYLYIPNAHGPFFDRDDEKFDRYDFCVHQNKVLVRKANIGTFQCRFIPWKGEDPTEMYFQFEYIG